ncbi:hypothetical protein [Pseudalkalibacillus caeni]|uniref:Uncharacterized protein n=1 Tax=Exobacillus caeni TaxID=2574798 RepID=A0A5R9F3Q9_9BACL|nr:hypothetical protein [Pseudalkalibacillus caeni]TLS36976.1 hypothetical protein FCL54_13570 [Pseudalkalibacillus caeni]
MTISNKDLISMENEESLWKVIEPVILKIRGKSYDVKSSVYNQLTRGQQSLMMFRVLYDHGKDSVTEFYLWMSLLVGEQPATWKEIKRSFLYFQDNDMLGFLEKTEREFTENFLLQGSEPRQLLDGKKEQIVTDLYEDFLRIVPGTKGLICAHIRSHPDEFLLLEKQ